MQAFHAKTLKGFEQILASELKELGASEVKPVNRGVNFSGSMSLLYKANFCLRTALRILMPVARFRVHNEDLLYRKIRAIDWSAYMSYKNSFAIDAVTFSKVFRNNHYVELKVKDAIADQFREKTSLRPSVDLKNADIRINVHVQDTQFTISLDSSGESLHRRGYRKHSHEASLSEVLAAGMVLMTGWKGKEPLYNPMCGSGTIALEAAMIATQLYPGITGRTYSFQNWPDYDPILFERMLESLPEPVDLMVPVIATDIDPEAVRMTKNNARGIDMDKQLTVRKEDFLHSEPSQGEGLVIINPPYGERLETENLNKFYGDMGSVLKHQYAGSTAWVFSANREAVKYLGLKPGKKLTLYNGPLECSFLKYTMFSGTRKEFKDHSV